MGKVIVVGIGPGSYEDMTIRADTALRACDAIVGYPVYVDLVRDRYPGKELHSTPMTRVAYDGVTCPQGGICPNGHVLIACLLYTSSRWRR